ncbi:DUF91 domain-containing protein [candidate division KSB1 bacterium]|nr:DUF91 domain-containing protein [candidate division KSB1 bacterium]
MTVKINPEAIEKLMEEFRNISENQTEELNIEELRNKFVSYFNLEKIKSLKTKEYFQGRGKKEGCFTYELEWATKILGGIGGGSVYKFGYEKDFKSIKTLLINLLSFKDEIGSFYDSDGNLNKSIPKIINASQNIKGLKSGRSLTGKFLRLYYPNTFIQIFNHQEHFLKQVLLDYDVDTIGLELFLKNNYLLIKIKNKLLDLITEEEQKKLSNYNFMKLLYKTFPITTTEEKINTETFDKDDKIEALEVQHYQTLIHRNRKKLFPDLVYFDEDYQNEHDGHFNALEAGTLDFLFVDKDKNFVVIELKRRSTDTTLGQILRYIGWVKENLADNGQTVKGIILAENKNVHLDFALKVVGDIVLFKKINLNVSIE